MAYGPGGGLLIVFIGAFVSSIMIFFAVRKFGRNFIYSFVSKEKVEEFESKWFSNQAKVDMVLIVLFLIPGTPKDLLVYIGGLLPIKPLKFLIISTFARFPSIISSTIAGNSLVEGNWHIIAISYAISLIFAGIVIYVYNKRSKTNIELK